MDKVPVPGRSTESMRGHGKANMPEVRAEVAWTERQEC
jgi:hypothetical protein